MSDIYPITLCRYNGLEDAGLIDPAQIYQIYDTDEEIAKELITTRKALDVANVILKNIKAFYQESYDCPNNVNWHTVAQRLANEAKDAIEQINEITKGGDNEL